jgi:hypothetical protein
MVTSIFNALRMEVRQKCVKWYSYINATGSVYALYNCVIFLTALEGEGGERDIQCRRCDSKKVKVHAENICPYRSPEVSLLEVCVPLDTAVF